MAEPSAKPHPARSAFRRAYRSFWLLLAVAVLTTGALSSALAAPPSPFTGLRVAVNGLVLMSSMTLATRVMLALERARRRARGGQT